MLISWFVIIINIFEEDNLRFYNYTVYLKVSPTNFNINLYVACKNYYYDDLMEMF